MPAPVASVSPLNTVNKSSMKPSAKLAKKKRIVRRRGRAPGDMTSDDEIEREAATDSDSDDDLSSRSSDSEPDTEPVSVDVAANGHSSRVNTPNTSHSSGGHTTQEKIVDHADSFFASSTNWSEMVADDEKAMPVGDLPVIEFANFDGKHVPTTRSKPKKAKKAAKTSRHPPETQELSSPVNDDSPPTPAEDPQHIASSSRSRPSEPVKRLPNQTARQAYQQRLESDPSYVPTVGGFWSHDDRLLDKDLRSLSGWWRDRRGGRGRGNGFRGRGRGGFLGPSVVEGHDNDGKEGQVQLPPIEQTWGHDGFEELKKREEIRKAAQEAQAQAQRSPNLHGRGFIPGRGGRRGFARGAYANTSGRSSVNSGRIWYHQRPERTWTKHLDASLYPTPGQGQIHVKLPGNKETKVIRTPYKPQLAVQPRLPNEEEEAKVYTVNLPDQSKTAHAATFEEALVEEVFKVRPSLAPKISTSVILQQPTPPAETTSPSQPHLTHHSPSHNVAATSSKPDELVASITSQLAQLPEAEPSDPTRAAKTEEAVLRNPLTEPQGEARPVATGEELLPTLTSMYSPPSLTQQSPSYSSPYGYGPTLPPGIALNQHGVPYELATGRPVYLQAPPPPPMYNPRPMHLAPAFVPTHMPSHSLSAVSPDFLAHAASHTPPMNGFIDPSTGTPIFSFPRQTSRIEIRAPTEGTQVKSPVKAPAPSSSTLRTSAASFEPSRSSSNGYYPVLSSPENGSLPSYAPVEGTDGLVDGVHHDPAMMAYAQYPQQQYYYPDAYGYTTYSPYVDMQRVQSCLIIPLLPYLHCGTVQLHLMYFFPFAMSTSRPMLRTLAPLSIHIHTHYDCLTIPPVSLA
ncbi:hypothetical protein H0H93_006739 [Arthromyces matolae]|nr:hypothetical protein H0H93_006739 [Arthromyces matolae]